MAKKLSVWGLTAALVLLPASAAAGPSMLEKFQVPSCDDWGGVNGRNPLVANTYFQEKIQPTLDRVKAGKRFLFNYKIDPSAGMIEIKTTIAGGFDGGAKKGNVSIRISSFGDGVAVGLLGDENGREPSAASLEAKEYYKKQSAADMVLFEIGRLLGDRDDDKAAPSIVDFDLWRKNSLTKIDNPFELGVRFGAVDAQERTALAKQHVKDLIPLHAFVDNDLASGLEQIEKEHRFRSIVTEQKDGLLIDTRIPVFRGDGCATLTISVKMVNGMPEVKAFGDDASDHLGPDTALGRDSVMKMVETYARLTHYGSRHCARTQEKRAGKVIGEPRYE